MSGREPSLGELADDFKELKDQLSDFMRSWPMQLEQLRATFVNKELYEARHNFVLQRLEKVENKDQVQDEAIKRVEDIIDARFSRLWTALVAGILFPIIIVVATILFTRGLG